MADSYPTTPKHFEIFKRECQKWIKVFGLSRWEFSFFHCETDRHLAWSTINWEAHYVAFHLNKTWRWKDQPPTSREVKKSAFHEVCEVLLFPIRYLGECRYLSESEMDPAVHEVIHVLEDVVWEDGKG